MSRALAFALALAVVTPVARVASAQSGDVAAARSYFEGGVRLLEDSRFADAAALLERSVALRESPAALYNLGLALRGMGAYHRAIAAFQRYDAAPSTVDSAQRTEARGVVDELRRLLAHVELRVMGGSSEVFVDGQRVAAGDTTQRLELDPGDHTIEARRRGFQAAHRSLRLEPGATAEVALDASSNPIPATLVIDPGAGDARVRVDGTTVGYGQLVRAVNGGVHVIDVVAPGREPMRRTLDVLAGSRQVVSFARPGAGVLASPWFWVGTGVVLAAAGAVAAVLLLRPVATQTGSWDTVAVPGP